MRGQDGQDATPPPAPSAGDATDPLVELLGKALATQTDAVVRGFDGLSHEFRGGLAALHAEARSTRRSLVGVIALAILILGGAIGVRAVVGDVVVAPAGPSATVTSVPE